jgi:hypothetical protein
LSVRRYLELKRVFYCAHRCNGVDRRANTAETLSKDPPLARIAPAQDRLKPAPHGAACPRLLNRAGVNLNINAQMPFNASDWIYGDTSDGDSPFGLPASLRHAEGHVAGHAMRPTG